jgi:hypothetical protein
MDDKILFYIVLGIIYFLFSRLKKKKPADEPDFDSTETPAPQNGPKPMSFEDLLREITEAKQPPVPQPPVIAKADYEQPKPDYVDYDDNLEEEEKSLETVIDDDRTYKIYEDAKKLAFNRPSLEDTLKLKEVNTEYAKFKQFESKTEGGLLADYLKELRDPKGFKKALILSEVINRKHF